MSRRAVLLLAVLIALIILFSFFMTNFGLNLPRTPLPGPTYTFLLYFEIVVTTVDLPAGTIIPANALTTCVWPPLAIPQRAYTLPRDVIGRRTRVDIPRGMPIIDSQILPGTAVPRGQTAATSPAFHCADQNNSVEVVIASQEISPGDIISKEAISVQRWLADALPPGVIQDPQLVIGKVARNVIPKGSVIVSAQFEEAATSSVSP